jgi:hypothetical protein
VATGTSTAFLQANEECTNRDPGTECPVEFTAQSFSDTWVAGDLNYNVDAIAGSDPDELEGHGGLDVREVNGETFYGSHVDSHDHLTRPRQTYQGKLSKGATQTTKQDDFKMTISQGAMLDAASIVPARVWDSTDVVTADAYVKFAHDIAVDASMTRPDEEACCGHGECHCAPKLRVVFKDERAWIECDGMSFPLDRNNQFTRFVMLLGADAPWVLS